MRPSDHLTPIAALGLAGLSGLGARRLLGPRQALPAPEPIALTDYFTAAQIRAGRDYARPQRRLSLANGGLELGLLVAATRRQRTAQPISDPTVEADPETERPSAGRAAMAAGVRGAALTLQTTALKLPLDALARRRSLAIGLSTQSWRDWASDAAKATALEAALSGGLHAGASALANRRPQRWWLGAAGGGVATATLAGLLAPVLTDPIFNAFTPLPDGETRRDVLELAERAGVSVGEVFSVDASRRTTAVNAYVNGLGPTKRVVLFDTLLSGHSRDEVRFVVAHELGHVRHRDVWRLIGFLALSAPGSALAVQELTRLWAGGLTGPRAVPALRLAMTLALLPLGLSGAALSRAIERRTDDFGLTLSDAPEALIAFFRQVAVANHADVSPGGVLHRLATTHPPVSERIGAALAFQQRQAA